MYANRFARIRGVTPADSTAIFNGLRQGGVLTAADQLRADPLESNWRQSVPQPFRGNDALMDDIADQLEVTWTHHRFHSDHNSATLGLFDRHRNDTPLLATRSAASFAGSSWVTGTTIAPDSIITTFGANLSRSLVVAPEGSLPTTLNGTTLTVMDANATETPAPLYFVSTGQINWVVPSSVIDGVGDITITNGTAKQMHAIRVARVAPGLFTATADGRGTAAALIVRVTPAGAQTTEPVTGGITFGRDSLFLLLYGTGFRHNSGLGGVRLTIGGEDVRPSYAGSQNQYPGLDQLNAQLPASLAGRGTVDVILTVDGVRANTVQLTFR